MIEVRASSGPCKGEALDPDRRGRGKPPGFLGGFPNFGFRGTRTWLAQSPDKAA
jgi:hypothetical protein